MKKVFTIFLSVFWVYFFIAVVLKNYRIWIRESDSFNVRDITVEGNDIILEKEIQKLAKIKKGCSIWSVDLAGAEERIRKNPFIDQVRVIRRYPDDVAIEIIERRPFVLLKTGGRFYTLDRENTLLPALPGKCYTLPILSCPIPGKIKIGSPVLGPQIQAGMKFLLQVHSDRPGLYAKISEIDPGGNDGLILYTNQGGIPVRIGQDGHEWKIRYLEAILQEMENNPSLLNADYIDLRFKGQVFVGFGA